MSDTGSKFTCGGCSRSYTWKAELANKRVKCKCGQVMTVPAAAPGAAGAPPVDDDLYALTDLAADAQRAAKAISARPAPPAKNAAAPAKKSAVARPSAGKSPAAGSSAPPAAAAAIPLAYLGAPRDRNRAAHTGIDPKRDYYAPAALLLAGIVLYIGYNLTRYSLGPAGIMAAGLGLSVVGICECILLVAFALVVAGPLNVSFGNPVAAVFKLAAIAIFCDGVTTWIDGALLKYAAGFGRGVLGFGVIGLPVALGVYWTTLIYLFDMDPGDSWMVVVLLAVYYTIVRTILIILLLNWVLTLSHVPSSSIVLPSFAGAPPPNPIVETVNELKEKKLLVEAKQYATQNSVIADMGVINAWYDAGCPNVWYEMSRDINGHGQPISFVVELPSDKSARAKCYQALKDHWKNNGLPSDDEALQDNGEPYLIVGAR
jgi:hypothetical protein